MNVQLRFVRRLREAANTESFYFEPQSALPFVAGQYLRYTLPHADVDDRGSARSFTIASPPTEPLVRLTTRLSDRPSSFKRALVALAPGAAVEASGPFGQFVFGDEDQPAAFIAGGIGITPFRAMLGDLAAAQRRANIALLYANVTSDIAFRAFFDGLVDAWPELRVVYTVTRPSPAWDGLTGRIDAPFIQQHVPRAARAAYYLCGPTSLVNAMRAVLVGVGVESGRIQYEGFPGYDSTGNSASRVGR
jgi:ferredoxin-NADP reductase